MAVPFYLQYYEEFDRNTKYSWLNYGLQIVCLFLYGILFHWIPIYLRSKRTKDSNVWIPYFRFLRVWDTFNRVFKLKLPWMKPIYIQPSLLVLFASMSGVSALLALTHTKDLDYQTRDYIISKRISRIAISYYPMTYILVIKNDLLTGITGLQHDRLVLLHKWVSRYSFMLICVHIGLSMNYWLKLGFDVMLVIPPQIFGYIAFSCFFFLNFGSLRFIRKWAFDFFLVEHRIFSFIMLLFSFFHNMKGSKSIVILAVHQLVLDRIISRVLSLVHTRTSPKKGKSVFEILDDDTILVTVPLRAYDFHQSKWYMRFLPKVNTWKPGQHVYLTVGKVKWFQQHPFTIASLSETKEMKFVIKVQRGFTKLMKKKIEKMLEERAQEREESGSLTEDLSSSGGQSIDIETDLLPSTSKRSTKTQGRNSSNSASASEIQDLEDLEELEDSQVIMKATFVGPVGAHYQPLIRFDSVVFFSTGSGSSFTFPVCLDLINTIRAKNQVDDYLGRPSSTKVRIVWCVKKIENIQWYKFIYDELVECRGLEIDIYVTRDEEHEVFNEKSITNSYTTDGSNTGYNSTTDGPTSNTKPEHNSDSKSQSEEVSSEELSDKSSENLLSKSSKSNYPGTNSSTNGATIRYHKGRPDLTNIIENEVADLTGKNMKALALVSCGPDDFTKTIRVGGQKYKWVSDAPDVYLYSESFD